MQSNKKSDQLDDTLYESNNKAKIEVKKKKNQPIYTTLSEQFQNLIEKYQKHSQNIYL
jgi:hypothetical protein